jgi:hypothetical protein
MFKPTKKRYRPERHFMRGPGPKWIGKHGGGIGPVTQDRHTDQRLLTSLFVQLARSWCRR